MTALVPEPLASIVVLALGLVLGSFLNVCIHRLPLGESLVRPGSRCPLCGSPIRWHHNVPLASWLLLGGRCAACRAPISWRYPLVEALSGLLMLALWRGIGPGAGFALSATFGLMLLVLFYTDLDHMLLPDAITLTGFGLGLATAWTSPFLGGDPWARTWAGLGGAALGAGILWTIGELYSRLRKVEAMGLGDVKMMAMVGAFTGPKGVLFTLFVASVGGAVVGLALIPLRGRTLRHTLPFGCFLAPAALAALLWGRRVIDWYLGLVAPGP